MIPLSRERIDECKYAEMHVGRVDYADVFWWLFTGLVFVAALLGAWRG